VVLYPLFTSLYFLFIFKTPFMKQKLLLVIPVICLAFIIGCNNNGNDEKAETNKEDSSSVQEPATENNTANLDATVVSPGHYKLLKDTAGLRIIEINYKPGETSGLHAHPQQAVYVIDGGKVELSDASGKKDTFDFKSGMAGLFPSATHSGKNIGNTNLLAVLVEVMRPDKPGTALDASMDATKAATKQYKKVAVTLGVRIIEISYKPGEKSAMHSHPDAAFYALTDGTAEFTGKDGTKATMEFKRGMAMVTPADTHSVKNMGKETLKGILIEVTRPMQ
jgi:quercetin dioxygenase-like cupin family protein